MKSSLPIITPDEKALERPPHLRSIYTISCAMKAKDFFDLLKKFEVKVLLDTRLTRTYRHVRFATEDDLRYFCQVHEIGYQVMPELMPSDELRRTLAKTFSEVKPAKDGDPQAWTNFLRGYYRLVATERKVLREDGVLRQLLYGEPQAVAIMCACRHWSDCHRSVVAGMLQRFIQGIEVAHLWVKDSKHQRPTFKSPRRYLLEDINGAGLKADRQVRRQS
ncbi:DUF488 family protein [Patescibacteria group bacterium]